jgi:hypothetical protein
MWIAHRLGVLDAEQIMDAIRDGTLNYAKVNPIRSSAFPAGEMVIGIRAVLR